MDGRSTSSGVVRYPGFLVLRSTVHVMRVRGFTEGAPGCHRDRVYRLKWTRTQRGMTGSEVLVSTARESAVAGTGGDTGRYSLLVARDSAEVLAAQRFRYEVFALEMGATLHSEQPGLDVDQFDQYCDHL